MRKRASRRLRKQSVPRVGPEEASILIKKFAAQQRIEIRLTEEQMSAILEQWNEMNPRLPAEITFYAGRRAAANLKVAGYRYRGDTCCV